MSPESYSAARRARSGARTDGEPAAWIDEDVDHRAQTELGWRPRFDFQYVLDRLLRGEEVFSSLSRAVGSKGYHAQIFEEGPYPVES
jgi:hypothetical protein